MWQRTNDLRNQISNVTPTFGLKVKSNEYFSFDLVWFGYGFDLECLKSCILVMYIYPKDGFTLFLKTQK
jgi:hypothetical protein